MLEALREYWSAIDSHLNITPCQGNEEIQDF